MSLLTITKHAEFLAEFVDAELLLTLQELKPSLLTNSVLLAALRAARTPPRVLPPILQ